jgi:hypothetical protein
MEEAVGRDPSDELPWSELVQLDLFLRDRPGERQAARRVIALEPRGPGAEELRNVAGYGR